jgi:hypothetical protein
VGSWLKQYQKIKADCCGFYAASKRIEAMELTGSPSEEQLSRCTLAIYNCWPKMTSRVYDIINNPIYIIGKVFPYPLCCDWLRRYTSFLECGDATRIKIRSQVDPMSIVENTENKDEGLGHRSVDDAHYVQTYASNKQNDEDNATDHPVQNRNDEQTCALEEVNFFAIAMVSEQIRPQRRKKAQNSRKRRADSFEGSSALDESAASLATSSLKLSEAYERSQKMKAEISVRQVAVEETKAQIEEMKAQVDICKMPLDPSASATECEKKNVRKKLLACLKLEADPDDE